ncbi:HAD family phosphatase [uncultured Lactobacillus sp.]|uniref:HAD family hydrolase n=1 Tax=uncultured Lactobacillus sp. TaxID=153152 RepID=UPI0026114D7F|nr:HAD family phosphatase [uncultured Lactobacillus sp.]
MLKNIIFDFGNVIMNYNPDRILDKYPLTAKEHEILLKNIFQSEQWLEIDAGKIDEQEATEIFKSRVDRDLKDKVQLIMDTWPEKVDFYEAVFEYISELRKQGYKIYGLSNTGMKFANFVKNSERGEYFDGYVFSAQEKIMKPNKRIYQILLNRYELKAKESIFIDDLAANTQAAKDLGMQGFTFRINRLDQLKEYIAGNS